MYDNFRSTVAQAYSPSACFSIVAVRSPPVYAPAPAPAPSVGVFCSALTSAPASPTLGDEPASSRSGQKEVSMHDYMRNSRNLLVDKDNTREFGASDGRGEPMQSKWRC